MPAAPSIRHGMWSAVQFCTRQGCLTLRLQRVRRKINTVPGSRTSPRTPTLPSNCESSKVPNIDSMSSKRSKHTSFGTRTTVAHHSVSATASVASPACYTPQVSPRDFLSPRTNASSSCTATSTSIILRLRDLEIQLPPMTVEQAQRRKVREVLAVIRELYSSEKSRPALPDGGTRTIASDLYFRNKRWNPDASVLDELSKSLAGHVTCGRQTTIMLTVAPVSTTNKGQRGDRMSLLSCDRAHDALDTWSWRAAVF